VLFNLVDDSVAKKYGYGVSRIKVDPGGRFRLRMIAWRAHSATPRFMQRTIFVTCDGGGDNDKELLNMKSLLAGKALLSLLFCLVNTRLILLGIMTRIETYRMSLADEF
jgi:hypothetical protein